MLQLSAGCCSVQLRSKEDSSATNSRIWPILELITWALDQRYGSRCTLLMCSFNLLSVWDQANGKIDAFVMAAGTGGLQHSSMASQQHGSIAWPDCVASSRSVRMSRRVCLLCSRWHYCWCWAVPQGARLSDTSVAGRPCRLLSLSQGRHTASVSPSQNDLILVTASVRPN